MRRSISQHSLVPLALGEPTARHDRGQSASLEPYGGCGTSSHTADELVLVSGVQPIRAKKARYYEDRRLQDRILPPPMQLRKKPPKACHDDWSALPPVAVDSK